MTAALCRFGGYPLIGEREDLMMVSRGMNRVTFPCLPGRRKSGPSVERARPISKRDQLVHRSFRPSRKCGLW